MTHSRGYKSPKCLMKYKTDLHEPTVLSTNENERDSHFFLSHANKHLSTSSIHMFVHFSYCVIAWEHPDTQILPIVFPYMAFHTKAIF